MNAKRWGVALRKNVVAAYGESKHSSYWHVAKAKTFRKFASRSAAREFQKTWPTPTYIVDLDDQVVVR